MLYQADFEDMVDEHEKSGADITLMYTKEKGVRRSSQGKYCGIQEDGQVTQIEVDPMISRFDNTMMEVFCLRSRTASTTAASRCMATSARATSGPSTP